MSNMRQICRARLALADREVVRALLQGTYGGSTDSVDRLLVNFFLHGKREILIAESFGYG